MSKLKYLVLIICCFIASCNSDSPSSPSENNLHKNEPETGAEGGANSNTNNNSTEDKYYFELEMPAAREIRTEAGSTKIYFKCNQSYSISTSGNISGLTLSHTYGEGDGSVTVSFDEVQYQVSGSNITWKESGYIIFTVKEGNKNNFNIVKKEFFLVRIGYKARV